MPRIFGYGEDALTLWFLNKKTSTVLEEFKDKTSPSDCLVFYRPSFGRSGKENSDKKQGLLAINLESILKRLLEHCSGFSSENNVKNVLLFFHNSQKTKPPIKTDEKFRILPIDYRKDIEDNFITLCGESIAV